MTKTYITTTSGHLSVDPKIVSDAERLADVGTLVTPAGTEQAGRIVSDIGIVNKALEALPEKGYETTRAVAGKVNAVVPKLIEKYDLGTSYGKWIAGTVLAGAAVLIANAQNVFSHSWIQGIPVAGAPLSGALNSTTEAFVRLAPSTIAGASLGTIGWVTATGIVACACIYLANTYWLNDKKNH